MGQHPTMKERQVYCWEVASAGTQKTKPKNCICCGSEIDDSYLTEYHVLHGFEVLLLKMRKRSKRNGLKRFFCLPLQGMRNWKSNKVFLQGKTVGYHTCVLSQTFNEIFKRFCLFRQSGWGTKDKKIKIKKCLFNIKSIMNACCYTACRMLIPCIAGTPRYTRYGPGIHWGWFCWFCWQEDNSSSLKVSTLETA